MATGSPLGLGLEVSLGNVHRLRKLSKGSHFLEESRLDLGFIVPNCKTPAPHLPVLLHPLCPLWIG